jgi:hypothetical protein
MTKMKRWLIGSIGILVTGFLLTPSIDAAAPPVISQVVTVQSAMQDEFGLVLQGTDSGAAYFGHPVVEGDVVHIYETADGIIYPPDVQGVADARNTLLMTTRIGQGASANAASPGVFSVHMTPRPANGAKIFVRVFNNSNVNNASFYHDSQVFTVSWTVDQNFVAQFSAGIQPIDGADNDGDTLNNSWEKSYGTDANLADSDGDGALDLDEIIAGTDPVNVSSTFIIADLLPIPPDRTRLTWKTELNRSYTVEKKEGLTDSEYQEVKTVKGNGSDYELLVPESTNTTAFYRIRVAMQASAE